ncbi:GNAT family N-acetyltransferase [Listeria sp. PSOL-1]|uniref:GNAT family N-acetyltransferase n=1 Tax=Listeria sp. PSOL-1 TaxID=1844999 RepID=UPI001E480B30|nr:GNAT family N-acetyltransferase [Listeria sp. PSOL-1]
MEITLMKKAHYPLMQQIYQEGIATRNATFEQHVPTFFDWDKKYLNECRLVAVEGKDVLGFAALLPFSSMHSYRGVAELSIYIAEKARGRKIGVALMEHLITESERSGFWTLLSLVFPENKASLHLHDKFGFQKKCTYDKLGEMNGQFRDVILLERRSQMIGSNGK